MSERATEFCKGLEFTAVHVPLVGELTKETQIDWEVTVSEKRDGVLWSSLTTEYHEGLGHLPMGWGDKILSVAIPRELVQIEELLRKGTVYEPGESGESLSDRRDVPLTPPKIEDVVHCLVMDAAVLDHPDFESWVSDTCLDADSRKAEALYNQCVAQSIKLNLMINLDDARVAFEDY